MTHGITIDLWLAADPVELAPALAADWASLLSDDERGRWQRFAREEDRQRFLLVRALVRKVLARQLGLYPQALRFTADVHGKPRLHTTAVGTTPHFNLSHTRGLSVLAITGAVELGVDVEAVERPVDLLALARRYFAVSEVQALEAAAPAVQRELFFSLWTLKEAWVKAKGLGLRVPLDEFSFEGPGLLPTPGGNADQNSITLQCAPHLGEQPCDWNLRLLQHGSFRIALAAACPVAQPMQLRLHDAWPLLSSASLE